VAPAYPLPLPAAARAPRRFPPTHLSLPGRHLVPFNFESLPGARYRVAWETDVTGGLRTSS